MQGAAPSQAALLGFSQGQHPAALSQQAHASGSANEAATAHESSSAVASAVEEAKEATGLTPIVDHLLESTVRQGRSLCTEAWLIEFVSGGVVQPCTILVKLTHTLPLKLVTATVHQQACF